MADLIVTLEPESVAATLAGMTTEQLREELARAVITTAAHFLRLALIVRALESRGEDLSGLRIALLPVLRLIAHGQLVPEAAVRFAEAPGLLRRIAALPSPDQRRLASGEPVELVVRRDDGDDVRLADPLRLTRDQVTQVFARDHLRTRGEQTLILEARTARPAVRPSPKLGKARPDRERGGITIGRSFASLADVLAALAALRGTPAGEAPPADEAKHVPVLLGEQEHRRLKVLAAQSDVPMSELIRKAMAAAGLIGGP